MQYTEHILTITFEKIIPPQNVSLFMEQITLMFKYPAFNLKLYHLHNSTVTFSQ